MIDTHVCDSSSWKREAEGTEIQGPPWLHSKFEIHLGSLTPSLKKKSTIQNKQTNKK